MMRFILNPRGRRLGAAALGVLTGAGLAGALAPASFAAVNEHPTSTWQTNGRVLAAVSFRDKLFIGGRFTALRAPQGVAGSPITRNHVAAISLRTGRVLDWNPNADGAVEALAILSHGKRVVVGGDFTHIGGELRKHAAVVGGRLGRANDQWHFGANGRVRAISASRKRIYLGGEFTSMGGVKRLHVASFSRRHKALNRKWHPHVNAVVRALRVSRKSLFVGGHFTAIDGHRKQHHFARISAKTGEVLRFSFHPDYDVQGIRVTSSAVYVAGAGNGGNLAAVDRSSADVRWHDVSDGDFQSLAIVDDVLYAGGHFANFCRNAATHGNPAVCDDPIGRSKLLAVSPASGKLNAFTAPVNSRDGVFVVTGTRRGLVIGGAFTTISGDAQQGVGLLHD